MVIEHLSNMTAKIFLNVALALLLCSLAYIASYSVALDIQTTLAS